MPMETKEVTCSTSDVTKKDKKLEKKLEEAKEIVKRISRYFPDYSELELYSIVVISLNVMEELDAVKESKNL